MPNDVLAEKKNGRGDDHDESYLKGLRHARQEQLFQGEQREGVRCLLLGPPHLGQEVGLSAEPLTVGEDLAPATVTTERERTDTTERSTPTAPESPSPAAPAPAPVREPEVEEDNSGPGSEDSGSGRGRNRGRSGGDD